MNTLPAPWHGAPASDAVQVTQSRASWPWCRRPRPCRSGRGRRTGAATSPPAGGTWANPAGWPRRPTGQATDTMKLTDAAYSTVFGCAATDLVRHGLSRADIAGLALGVRPGEAQDPGHLADGLPLALDGRLEQLGLVAVRAVTGGLAGRRLAGNRAGRAADGQRRVLILGLHDHRRREPLADVVAAAGGSVVVKAVALFVRLDLDLVVVVVVVVVVVDYDGVGLSGQGAWSDLETISPCARSQGCGLYRYEPSCSCDAAGSLAALHWSVWPPWPACCGECTKHRVRQRSARMPVPATTFLDASIPLNEIFGDVGGAALLSARSGSGVAGARHRRRERRRATGCGRAAGGAGRRGRRRAVGRRPAPKDRAPAEGRHGQRTPRRPSRLPTRSLADLVRAAAGPAPVATAMSVWDGAPSGRSGRAILEPCRCACSSSHVLHPAGLLWRPHALDAATGCARRQRPVGPFTPLNAAGM